MAAVKRKDSREATVWLTVFSGLIFGYPWVFGWDGWTRLLAVPAALLSTFILMFTAGFVRGFIRDTWPAVPASLADTVVRLRAGGWSTDQVHHWWDCAEKRPHVHMTHQDRGPLILIWNGITILDQDGNAVRHEM